MSVAAQDRATKESIDAEHIFGFTEGSNIGDKGEIEFENTSVAQLGRKGGYAGLQNEAAFRYGVLDDFRASLGVLADYHYVHDSPDMSDLHRADFSGLSSEFRWAAHAREGGAVGLTLSFAPLWRRVDATSGAHLENYTLPLTALIDYAPLPGRLVTAFNATYFPNFERVANLWQTEHSIEFSAAAAYAIAPNLFWGAEIRHDQKYQTGVAVGHALFVGPSVFIKISDSMSMKLAWSAQINDLGAARLDLTNYQRHEILLLLVKSF